MPLSGKYDFQGIKKYGAAGLRLALASSPYSAWTLKFKSLTDFALEFISNWLANKGLILLNTGADWIKGEFDQHNFDSAMDQAMAEITRKGGREALTAAQREAIDAEVIRAARRFIVIGKP